MDFRLRGRKDETFEEMRQRLVAETSAYLTECLKHPELMVHIPSVPADKERFPPSFAASFWDSILLD
jgi:hypothetical protein